MYVREQPRRHRVETRARAPLALLALLALASPSLALQPAEPVIAPELLKEIEALVLNVWDQRMARQFQMGLDLPRSEVRARFDVFSRWLEEIRKGTFPVDENLPAELLVRHEALAKSLSDDAAPADHDAVLLFLEENVRHLEAASGIRVSPPM